MLGGDNNFCSFIASYISYYSNSITFLFISQYTPCTKARLVKFKCRTEGQIYLNTKNDVMLCFYQ